MPDLQQFSVTPQSAAQVSVPRAVIAAQVVESGAVIADFTGANAIQFPAVIKDLTAAQLAELIDIVASWLVLRRAGL